jgi:signal transduction histidine kinase
MDLADLVGDVAGRFTRRLIEAHGGTIAVESRLGEGSVFTVRLPLERSG